MSNHVQFPGLGLEFDINRVAFAIGDFNIYWYGLLIAAGFCLALVFAFANAKKLGIDDDKTASICGYDNAFTPVFIPSSMAGTARFS